MSPLQGGSKNPSPAKCQSHICALWLIGTLSMDSLNLGEIRLLHRQSRNILELDTLGSEPRKSETTAWLSEFLPRLPMLWGNKTDLKFAI